MKQRLILSLIIAALVFVSQAGIMFWLGEPNFIHLAFMISAGAGVGYYTGADPKTRFDK